MKKRLVILTICASVFLTGCATNSGPNSSNENEGKVLGTLIGSIGGAVLGKQAGGKNGAIIGALIGGGVGYLIGNDIDERRAALKKIAQKEHAQIVFEDIKDEKGDKVGQSFDVHTEKSEFDSGKDILNLGAKPMFVAIAKQYATSGQKVLIVGHTDSDGSDAYNQALSERRAQSIAHIFKDNGVKEANIYYRGAGEYEPISSNQTSKGKAQNRRVEVVEAPNEITMANYALNKQVNSGFYTKEKNPKVKSTHKSTNKSTHKAGNTHLGSLSLGVYDLNMTIGLPKITIGGISLPKFKFPDINGSLKFTGVSGPYYVSKKSQTKNPLGSCNNDYFYSKKTNFALKQGESKKENQNQLAHIIGKPKEAGSFSFITQAHADSGALSYYSSCLQDKVRNRGKIKKLSTDEEILVKNNYNLAPVLDGSTWGAFVDKEFVMFGPVGVLRSNMQSVTCPELNIVKKGSNQPWYGTTTKIVTYNGENGLLYRIYPKDKSKIECIDMAYPHGNPQNAQGVIYYKDSTGKTLYKKTKFFSLDNEGEHI